MAAFERILWDRISKITITIEPFEPQDFYYRDVLIKQIGPASFTFDYIGIGYSMSTINQCFEKIDELMEEKVYPIETIYRTVTITQTSATNFTFTYEGTGYAFNTIDECIAKIDELMGEVIGSITINPPFGAGSTTPSEGTIIKYKAGDTITILAEPLEGWAFQDWTLTWLDEKIIDNPLILHF